MSWVSLSEGEGETPSDTTLHATCVAFASAALLIRGASGSGKSALALDLMARGAGLVADDRTRLRRRDGRLIADAPPALRGMIEARGIGLLAAEAVGPALVALVVDMDEDEVDRLPQVRETSLMGVTLPLLRRVAAPHFAPALLQMLKTGRREPA